MRGILSDHDMEGHFRALISIWERRTLARPLETTWCHGREF